MWLGERKGRLRLTPQRPIVWSYFTRTDDGHVLANNCFIGGGAPEIDFTYPRDVARQASVVLDAPPDDTAGVPLGHIMVGDTVLKSPLLTHDDAWMSPVATPLCTASTPYMRREVVIWGDCVKLRCVPAAEARRLLGGRGGRLGCTGR